MFEYLTLHHGQFNTKSTRFVVNESNKVIHFKGKNYTITSVEKEDNQITYKAECLRHNGKRHFKLDTSFTIIEDSVGYCEFIYIEV